MQRHSIYGLTGECPSEKLFHEAWTIRDSLQYLGMRERIARELAGRVDVTTRGTKPCTKSSECQSTTSPSLPRSVCFGRIAQPAQHAGYLV